MHFVTFCLFLFNQESDQKLPGIFHFGKKGSWIVKPILSGKGTVGMLHWQHQYQAQERLNEVDEWVDNANNASLRKKWSDYREKIVKIREDEDHKSGKENKISKIFQNLKNYETKSDQRGKPKTRQTRLDHLLKKNKNSQNINDKESARHRNYKRDEAWRKIQNKRNIVTRAVQQANQRNKPGPIKANMQFIQKNLIQNAPSLPVPPSARSMATAIRGFDSGTTSEPNLTTNDQSIQFHQHATQQSNDRPITPNTFQQEQEKLVPIHMGNNRYYLGKQSNVNSILELRKQAENRENITSFQHSSHNLNKNKKKKKKKKKHRTRQ